MKKNILNNSPSFFAFTLILVLLTPLNFVFSFAYIFASEDNGVNLVTHPIGYDGTGGSLTVTVGINPLSPNAADMVIPTQNVVGIYNAAMETSPNYFLGAIPSGNVDFESVLLHELGHSLGLAHCNLATESNLPGSDQNYTKTTDGANDFFDLNAGIDGIIGSEDDIRGDDENLNYFKISDNNPFTTTGIIDQTTYSRDLIDLPSGNFSTNGDRDVAFLLGFINTEAVMQQGSFTTEIQRTLSADDVAGISYAEAGVDEVSGTIDDYSIILEFIGLTDTADIVISFDNSETSFAVSQSGAAIIAADHAAITTSRIFLNTNFNWFFNPTLNIDDVVPNPSELYLFPNPADHSVTISNQSSIILENITIYDIKGRLIKSIIINRNTSSNLKTIDISKFASGLYLFKIQSDKGEFTKRVIKQ